MLVHATLSPRLERPQTPGYEQKRKRRYFRTTRRGARARNLARPGSVGSGMAENCWESIKAEGNAVLDQLKELLRQGNIRRVRVRQGTRVIAEFPLTAGVVGAVFAPVLAAIGALVALAKDCTIEIERDDTAVVVTDAGRA